LEALFQRSRTLGVHIVRGNEKKMDWMKRVLMDF
jgi:hypothetical protein